MRSSSSHWFHQIVLSILFGSFLQLMIHLLTGAAG